MLTLYIVFAWLLGICYGFVLISSAAGHHEANLFQVGESSLYQFHSTVLLNEKGDGVKNVGFLITADVLVHSVWGQQDQRLLKLELKSPQLHIRSRKAPSPDGFVQHSSRLDDYTPRPFFVVWNKGRIDKVLMPNEEPLALANLKKGIASLFQFQLLDVEQNETDSSGTCKTLYHSIDATKFEKTKTDCLSVDLPYIKTPESILSTTVTSTRKTTYELEPKFNYIKAVYAKETHWTSLAIREDLGNFIQADQSLTHVKVAKTDAISGYSLDEVVNKLAKSHTQESLLTEREELSSEDSKTLVNLVNDVREHLKKLGELTSAKAFLRLVEAARRSNREEIAKVLASKKNQKILAQLYDVFGHVQSENVHEAVMKKLHFDQEDHLDLSERYLWALSMSSQPNIDIITDLYNRYRKNDNIPDKVKETLILTLASMAHTLGQTTPGAQQRKIGRNIEELILTSLEYAKDEKRFVFLRALKNLKSPSTIPVLLAIVKNGSLKEGVLAFKALKSFADRNPDVIKAARRAFFQLDRKYDTSSRTLSVDILLESNPSTEILRELLLHLRSNDTSYEVKQYVYQRLQMMADEDVAFKAKIWNIIRSDPTLNNYSALAPRGLSTALKRSFVRNPSINGSLLTIQEIFGGIVKRGIVNVVLEKNQDTKEIFSLGIFAGGLSSLLSSEMEGDEETATAGMELTILDTQIRPFVFFTGQGELMGHVWSGTASERTTAFQASILLQDHLEYLRLGAGFIAEVNLKGATSFDLSGKMEVSIWSRNADSVVEKSAGVVVNGLIAVDSAFVQSKTEFSASLEPKLSLKSDIDFSSNMNLCMRVTQPDVVFRHNVFKIERIPGSKHKIRIAKYRKTLIPGTTYSLNRKNNEMCSVMFS